MRLAIISDIHGNLLALEAVLKDITTRAVDDTINLGDWIAGPLWPRETFELLQSLEIPSVRGNHDRWATDRPDDKMPPAGRFARDALDPVQVATLFALPETIERADGAILACHGTPTDDMAYLLEESLEGRLAPASRAALAERLGAESKRQVVLCGHSHRQALVTGPDGCLVLNPGSVGCPSFADLPAAANLEHRSPHARYAILTHQNGRWAADLIALEYDWDAAAQKAAELGWPKWATMLKTGAVS
ncbi:MAG: metallophosphoesterase family protein [Acetobacteraceae bacterium]|nr:metallophosphoesterase family protein [Acetobacteraceae bacterium]